MGFVSDFVGSITGSGARDAASDAANIQASSATEAIQAQEEAAARAQQFFQPLQGVADRGIQESSFLANPQAQFDFLQSNPLFNLALQNANQQTSQMAAARGRLSAGDTLSQLSNNVLLAAQPLIDAQRQDVSNLLNISTQLPTAQANIETGSAAQITPLITDRGASLAAGEIGRANAKAQGAQNLISLGTQIFGAL